MIIYPFSLTAFQVQCTLLFGNHYKDAVDLPVYMQNAVIKNAHL